MIASSLITGARKAIGESIALGMATDVALVARTEADLERALAAYPRINILASCAGIQRRMTVTVQAGYSRTRRNGDRVPMLSIYDHPDHAIVIVVDDQRGSTFLFGRTASTRGR